MNVILRYDEKGRMVEVCEVAEKSLKDLPMLQRAAEKNRLLADNERKAEAEAEEKKRKEREIEEAVSAYYSKEHLLLIVESLLNEYQEGARTEEEHQGFLEAKRALFEGEAVRSILIGNLVIKDAFERIYGRCE